MVDYLLMVNTHSAHATDKRRDRGGFRGRDVIAFLNSKKSVKYVYVFYLILFISTELSYFILSFAHLPIF